MLDQYTAPRLPLVAGRQEKSQTFFKKQFVYRAKSGKISIYNIWDKRGYSESQRDSSGMILEEQGNKTIYHCNDCGFDTADFDKLVFSIEKL